MDSSLPAAGAPSPGGRGLGRQAAFGLVGAVLGAGVWLLLSVPQHLINVIFSVLVGLGAGLGAGRASGVARSASAAALAVVTTAVVLLLTQSVITRQYLSWASHNLPGTPSNPDWDGAIGALRLTLDRAAGRNGWTANASYFYWFVSLALAGCLAWFTARPARRRT